MKTKKYKSREIEVEVAVFQRNGLEEFKNWLIEKAGGNVDYNIFDKELFDYQIRGDKIVQNICAKHGDMVMYCPEFAFVIVNRGKEEEELFHKIFEKVG